MDTRPSEFWATHIIRPCPSYSSISPNQQRWKPGTPSTTASWAAANPTPVPASARCRCRHSRGQLCGGPQRAAGRQEPTQRRRLHFLGREVGPFWKRSFAEHVEKIVFRRQQSLACSNRRTQIGSRPHRRLRQSRAGAADPYAKMPTLRTLILGLR